MYSIDGSSHKNGIKSEKIVLKLLNDFKKSNMDFKKIIRLISQSSNKKIDDYNFQILGGTNQIADIYDKINKLKISLKSKKIDNGKIKGTFDLLNTSKIMDFIDPKNMNFIKEYKRFLKYKKDVRGNAENGNINIEKTRREVEEYVLNLINFLDSKTLAKILKKVKERYKGINITIIRFYEKIDILKLNDLKFLSYDWLKKEIRSLDIEQKINTTKKSFSIKTKDNLKGSLRLRMVLNNGIKAFIGCNPKNKDSILTFKIQLDKVKDIIEKYEVKFNK